MNWAYNSHLGNWINMSEFSLVYIDPGYKDEEEYTPSYWCVKAENFESKMQYNLAMFETEKEAREWMDYFMRLCLEGKYMEKDDG